MEYKYKYDNLADRQVKVKEAESKGYIMLYDNFDTDWVKGEEPHGEMTFTDVIKPTTPARNLWAEIDELKAEVASIKTQVSKV